MNEIAERLRNWRLVHLAQLRYLMETASDEIERLQALADKRGELAVERRREILQLRERLSRTGTLRTPKMSSGEPMTNHSAGQREPSAPSRGSVANHDADARLAALEQLSALDQELELQYGLTGNPMIKAQQHTPQTQPTPGEGSVPREGT